MLLESTLVRATRVSCGAYFAYYTVTVNCDMFYLETYLNVVLKLS